MTSETYTNSNGFSPSSEIEVVDQTELIDRKTEINNREQMAPTMISKSQAQKLEKFYTNKTVLMTGVTGFIGKVCLVKLMHSLKSCRQVYVMLRPKKGMTPQQRFNKLISEEPFVPTPSKNPNGCPYWETTEKRGISHEDLKAIDWSIVTAVEGDMSVEDLGFADDIKEKLCKSVDIVFNIAASVSFDAPLKQNLRDNYVGAKNLLQLAMRFEKLISYVHVSTFYINSHISHVEEKVLPMNRDCEKMAELITWIPDSMCDTISPQIMENRPNTYIFTKAMAENLIQKYEGHLPIAIVRPSIVTPSWRDPYPGWVDSVNGPMGLGVLGSLGILRNIDWNYYGVCDFVPVDIVVNLMLAVAERTPRMHPNEIKVYNCSTSLLKPMTWGQGFEILREESYKAPPYKMLRVPIDVPKHKRASRTGLFMSKISELLFAYFVDFLLMIFGQKQMLTKLTAKLHHGYKILRPFTTTAYTCSNDNLLAAYNELDENDKDEFCFDPRKCDWDQNFRDSYYGARRRLLKEDISNVMAATRKMKILMVVEFVFKIMFYAFVAWAAYRLYGYFVPQPLSL